MAYAIETLTIADTETDSAAMPVPERGRHLIIETPAALTGTVTLYGTLDGTTFKPVFSGGAAVTLEANALHTVSPVEVNAIKLVSGSAEAADRVFTVKVD